MPKADAGSLHVHPSNAAMERLATLAKYERRSMVSVAEIVLEHFFVSNPINEHSLREMVDKMNAREKRADAKNNR